MKKTILLMCIAFQCVFAQNDVVNQVLVLNEGRYDYETGEITTPVTIGSYDPITTDYSVVDTIDGARYANRWRLSLRSC
jgi:hypothetical protein